MKITETANLLGLLLLAFGYVLRTAQGWVGPGAVQSVSSLCSSSAGDSSDAFLQRAEQLRKEVEALEHQKQQAAETEQRKIQHEIDVKNERRMRYSATLPILKPDGSTVNERCDFTPVYPEGTSSILRFEANLPLGILLGESLEHSGVVEVDEVASCSNGEAAGISEGDIFRACTACRFDMEQPTWQLIAGGIGRPKTNRFMYVADNRPFEEIMDAIGSNRMMEDQPVVIIVERKH